MLELKYNVLKKSLSLSFQIQNITNLKILCDFWSKSSLDFLNLVFHLSLVNSVTLPFPAHFNCDNFQSL